MSLLYRVKLINSLNEFEVNFWGPVHRELILWKSSVSCYASKKKYSFKGEVMKLIKKLISLQQNSNFWVFCEKDSENLQILEQLIEA